MRAPQFGVGLQGDRPLSDYPTLGRLAEGLSFDVVSVFADAGYLPPLAPLLQVAAATERVRLGPSCLNPFTTHPVEIASQIATLDAFSGGRAYLGLARGAWLAKLGVEQPRPVRAIREAAEVVGALLRGDERGYAGEVFRVEPGFRLRFSTVRARVPLLIGGWGERTVALAGQIADELKVGGSANADLVPVMRTRLARGAAAAGRAADPDIVLGAVTVVDDDAVAARARARVEVAMYFEVVARLDPTLEVRDELVRDIGSLLDAGDARQAGALIPDQLLERFAFCGTPAQVTRQVRRIFDAGATRVDFGAPFGLDVDGGLRMLGERVLPEFR